MSDTTLDQVLSQRRETDNEIVDVDEPELKLVIFELSGRHFAFRGECIREILSGAEVFFVPGCPNSIEGVINVRGDIESVLRLNTLLNLGEPAAGPTSILLGHASSAAGGIVSGIRVDRVIEVVDVPQSRIQPPHSALPEVMRPFVSGALEFEGLAVALLDIDRLFSDFARGLG